MKSILVTGANLSERKKYIKKQLKKLDVAFIDQTLLPAQDSVKIEQVRQALAQLQKKPIKSHKRAGVIYQAEKATPPAQNALLKLLEEPPSSVYLFLASPSSARLLPTIVSRCKIIRLPSTAKLNKNTAQTIKKIFTEKNRSIGESFKMAENIALDRSKTDEFLQQALLYFRTQYTKENKLSQKKKYARLAEKTSLSRRFLTSNVNPRQVLEELFL